MAERFRLLLDMNLSPMTVQTLRSIGWDAHRVSEFLSDRSTDEEILKYARLHNLVVITHDVDFTALLALGRHTKPSVIHLRIEDATPSMVTKRLVDVLDEFEQELLAGVIVSVDETSARYRNLPIS
jgi:predicted nuclease of predicted toxin-antitoxin system